MKVKVLVLFSTFIRRWSCCGAGESMGWPVGLSDRNGDCLTLQ